MYRLKSTGTHENPRKRVHRNPREPSLYKSHGIGFLCACGCGCLHRTIWKCVRCACKRGQKSAHTKGLALWKYLYLRFSRSFTTMGISREKIEFEVSDHLLQRALGKSLKLKFSKSFNTVGIRENLNLRFSKSYTMALLWAFMGASGCILVAPQLCTQLSSEQRQLSQSKDEK